MSKHMSGADKSIPQGGQKDDIESYIEECRQFVAKARRFEVVSADSPAITRYRGVQNKNGSKRRSVVNKLVEELKVKEQVLHKLEADLTKREVDLLERQIKQYGMQLELEKLRPLSGLYRVIQAMATERKLESLLTVITKESRNILGCDQCRVFIRESDSGELWTRINGKGTEIRLPFASNTPVGLTARTGRVVNLLDVYADNRFSAELDEKTGYRSKSVLCVPMHNRNHEVIGVFEVLNKREGAFSAEDEEWLNGLAAVAGGLIEQAQAYAEIENFVIKTLETLAQTIDKRDPLTAGHSMRVTHYALLIGEALGTPEIDMNVLRYAAMMHDYGKIGVPEAVLWKNGRLTPAEYELVQTHARITYELLSNLPFNGKLATVPYVASCHHEKLDGSGYYRKLKGQEIPYLTRVITVADVFDALTSVRHYRNRMAISKVAEVMEAGRENHFDPEVIDAFFNLPCDKVLKVMESERGQSVPVELDLFHNLSLGRLIELVDGAKTHPDEEGLADLFQRIYCAGLPPDYQALD